MSVKGILRYQKLCDIKGFVTSVGFKVTDNWSVACSQWKEMQYKLGKLDFLEEV